MHFTPYSYLTTAADINTLKLTGFTFEGSFATPELFINRYFPNLDLLSVIVFVDPLLAATTSSTIYRKIILNETGNPSLEIQIFSSDHTDRDAGMVMVRTFISEATGPVVEHEFLSIPKPFRKKGISKIILKTFFQQYVNIGIKKILVYAALEDGGLVWAKSYFMATIKSEMAAILDTARRELPVAQFNHILDIYNNYYAINPEGQAFPIYQWAEIPIMEPILKRHKWHGAVDLTNPKEFSNFVSNAIG